jgi:hypothetical protein
VGALELGRGQRGPVRSFDPARTEGDPHRRQVDVVPPQREQLSSPRPGDRGQHYEDVEDRIAGGDVGEQPLHLRGCRGRISRGGTTRRCARPAGLSRSKCQAPVPERHSGHGTRLTGWPGTCLTVRTLRRRWCGGGGRRGWRGRRVRGCGRAWLGGCGSAARRSRSRRCRRRRRLGPGDGEMRCRLGSWRTELPARRVISDVVRRVLSRTSRRSAPPSITLGSNAPSEALT